MKDNKYYVVEVKHKEMFNTPPLMGQGLDIRQVKARMQFYKDTTTRCTLFRDKTRAMCIGNGLTCWKMANPRHKELVRIYNIMGLRKAGGLQ